MLGVGGFRKAEEVIVKLPPVLFGAPTEVIPVRGQEDDGLVEGDPELAHGGWEAADERVHRVDEGAVLVVVVVLLHHGAGQPRVVPGVGAQRRRQVSVHGDQRAVEELRVPQVVCQTRVILRFPDSLLVPPRITFWPRCSKSDVRSFLIPSCKSDT